MTYASKLQKLKNANYRETEILTLPDDMQIILSTMTGLEDRDMSDYLRNFLDKSIGHYTKLETLAYAIKWIKTPDGDVIDLHDIIYIDTENTLENGTVIKRKRNEYMRDIVNSWPDIIVDTLFTKYALLIEDIEKGLSKGIKVELGDSALRIKIEDTYDELKSLVKEAFKKNIEIDTDIASLFDLDPKKNATNLDKALKAYQKETTKNIDEELPQRVRV